MAAAKTTAATTIVGGTNDNQLKRQRKKRQRCSSGGDGNSNGDGNGDGDRNKNSANTDNGASTTAMMMMYPGSASRQKTALLPRLSPSDRHHRCSRAEMMAAMGTTTMATVAALTLTMRTTTGEIEEDILAGVECKPEQWGI